MRYFDLNSVKIITIGISAYHVCKTLFLRKNCKIQTFVKVNILDYLVTTACLSQVTFQPVQIARKVWAILLKLYNKILIR